MASTEDRLNHFSSSSRRLNSGGGRSSQNNPIGNSFSNNQSSRSPSNSRIQSQRQQRSVPPKKPPEPLRRAVADCLSSSHGFSPAPVISEAATTFRDYLSMAATVDMAYAVLLEHALAEKDRSPAVMAKCVALLKRYLLRYIPRLHILQQIDMFCANTIAECDPAADRKISPWSNSIGPETGTSAMSGMNSSSPFHSSVYASVALLKSLNYIRALVARHMPRLSFQPAALTGTSYISKQSMSSLSSLLSKSFNSNISSTGFIGKDPSESTEVASTSSQNLFNHESIDKDGYKYIASDLLNWRWLGDRGFQLLKPSTSRSDRPQVIHKHNFCEVGAAALLMGETDRKLKGHIDNDVDSHLTRPGFDQLLQPSTVTSVTNIASACSHLRAITAIKRLKPGSHQFWEDTPTTTFRTRSRPLFQYRPYSDQQPLRLSVAEIQEVITAVCSEISAGNVNPVLEPYKHTSSGGPSVDVAVSVLIKLIIDMYVLDSDSAAPLTLSLLEEMVSSSKLAARVRVFDLILNLGVHAHLLEPVLPDDGHLVEEESPRRPGYGAVASYGSFAKRDSTVFQERKKPCGIDEFESWLLDILYEVLLLLVQREEKEEAVWASGFSCLIYLVCNNGKLERSRLKGLDIRVVKSLLEISREHFWAEELHRKLICILTSMFYQVPKGLKNEASNLVFSIGQVELLGGIEFVCSEYSRASAVEEKRNLFTVLVDFVIHAHNKISPAGGSLPSSDDVRRLTVMLALVDAPEAFYIAVKHGVDGIGGILRRSIASAMTKYDLFDHLNLTLLENITSKLDAMIASVTHLDEEFSDMMQVTKAFRSLQSIDDGLANGVNMDKVKLSWATLYSLLHSKRISYRHNGYIWLIELLVSEIVDGNDKNDIWLNLKRLQLQLEKVIIQDASSGPNVPLPAWVLCGLLKSKYNFIRSGFLYVLERLLMRCQLLLNDSEFQHVNGEVGLSYDQSNDRLEKANAVIGVMNSALLLVVSINETDRSNVLKMCDLLFSQLCLRTPLSSSQERVGDVIEMDGPYGSYGKKSIGNNVSDDKRSKSYTEHFLSDTGTSSLAALLLWGEACVPMQLVACVSTDLFYWPLIQLAGAATDDIALGISVGSKGRGSLAGSASDTRAALLLLLIGKCTTDPAAFQDFGGEEFFRRLLDDTDARVAYYTSSFLLKRMMTEESEKYQRILHSLVSKAQQCNNEKLLENPYLQMRGILHLSNDIGTQI